MYDIRLDICTYVYIHTFVCMYSPTNAKGLRDVEEALFSISLLDHPVPQAGAPGQTPDPGYIVTGDFLRESVLGKGGGGRGAVGQDGWRRGGELAETRIDMKAYAREVLCLGGRGGGGGEGGSMGVYTYWTLNVNYFSCSNIWYNQTKFHDQFHQFIMIFLIM
jgi:hypothetical protein